MTNRIITSFTYVSAFITFFFICLNVFISLRKNLSDFVMNNGRLTDIMRNMNNSMIDTLSKELFKDVSSNRTDENEHEHEDDTSTTTSTSTDTDDTSKRKTRTNTNISNNVNDLLQTMNDIVSNNIRVNDNTVNVDELSDITANEEE